MKKNTGLKKELHEWIYFAESATRDFLREYGQERNYDIATTDRELRELTEEGKVKPVYDIDGKFIRSYEIIK